MKLIVSQPQRYAKMRAHTATHLLHAILEKILGQTKQEGSLVDEDYLRFDFATKQGLSDDQLRRIEDVINAQIIQGHNVSTQEMSIDDARQTGAKMFFGDKYGETVRVVLVGDEASLMKGGRSEATGGIISTELCGGTHVTNTRDIGAFVIVGQESVASGVKRLIAYTGPKVAYHAQKKQSLITDIMADLGVAGESQLLPKISKMQSELKEQAGAIEGLKAKLVGGVLATMELTPHGRLDGVIAIDDYVDLAGLKIKTIAMEARQVFDNHTVLLYDAHGTFALVATGGTSARELARELGLTGGGSDDLVQGRDGEIMSKVG